MHGTFEKLIDEDILIPVLAIFMGCMVAIVAIFMTAIRAMVVGKERERTKREMAAYVAEGSIPPDKAVAILNAGDKANAEAGC